MSEPRKTAGTADWLADELTRRKTVCRWWIWTGRPLLRRDLGDDAKSLSLPKSLSPHPFPLNVVRIAACVLFAMTLSLLLWGLIPFLLIWFVGALLDHPTAYVGGMQALFWLQVFAVSVASLAIWSTHDDRSRDAFERVRVAYAGLALPVLMYITSTSDPEGFNVLGHPQGQRQGIVTWLAFYAYMYADILSFGAIESLVGELTSLQPASFRASLFTFLTQSLMTVSILYHAFKYVARKVFAFEEFSGTFRELLQHLNEIAPSRGKCYVMPRYVQRPVEGFDEPSTADSAFEIAAADAAVAVRKRFEPPVWRFLRPGVWLQVVVAVVALLAIGLAALPVSIKWSVILLVTLLVFLTVLTLVLLPALARARESAERMKCQVHLRQIAHSCLVYAVEKGRFPPDLRALLEFDPTIEGALLCPTHSRENIPLKPGEPMTREETLAQSSYTYLGASLRFGKTPSAPLIHDRPQTHRGGANVVLCSGEAVWMTEQELAAALATA